MSRQNGNKDYKRILSQLFDIKPMKDSVDLDWEKIKQVKSVVSLRGKMTENELQIRREALILNHANRVAVLRENESLVFVKRDRGSEIDEPVNINRNIEQNIATSQLLFDDYFASVGTVDKSRDNNYIAREDKIGDFVDEEKVEPIVYDNKVSTFDDEEDEVFLPENNHPTREEILQELEEIEARDRYMEQVSNHSDESECVIENFKEDDIFSHSVPPAYIRASIVSFIVIAVALSLVFPVASLLDKNSNINDKVIVAGVATSVNLDNDEDVSYDLLSNKSYSSLYNKFFNFLNESGEKYLLLFQDNGEIRATGGFLKFYGILNMNNGNEVDLFVDDVFSLDSQLNTNVIPPRPIQKTSTAWSMRDINWFPDFPTSAQKALWMYEEISNESMDGVITFTPQIITQILDAIGPVFVEDYGMEITSENFIEIIQGKSKEDFDDILSVSKNIFVDFIPYFMEKINDLGRDGLDEIVPILLRNIGERHILMYFSKEESEDFILQQGWGGESKKSSGDFLSVINSNFDGYKTERMMDEEIRYVAEIQEDGSTIGTVEIHRTHTGNRLGGRANLNYVRVYVPEGARLMEASGHGIENYEPPIDYGNSNFKSDVFVDQVESSIIVHESGTEIFRENGKTVFGNWVVTEPESVSIVTYKYKLPFKLDFMEPVDNYSLTVQKQSGSIGSRFIGEIVASDNLMVDPASMLGGVLETDLFYSSTIKRK